MLKIYNTLSKQKEELEPIQGKRLNIFVCGPTTYDFSHIGHARTYIAFDMIVKYLRQKGRNVFYLQNITDIEDKIIKRAKEQNEDPKELALRFEKEYMADMEALGISAVSEYARATDHIPEIISQIERLLEKGYAYEIPQDGVYFDILKFEDYGKLSHRTSEQAQDAVSRIDESVGKRNKGDFALWKLASSEVERFEPSWPSPWGAGRPGWHIEDTAITEKFFGPQYDIHGGAQDLIFPHHEAEITQMEAVSGKKPFVKVWMHTGFLTVQGEKMSKSLGNFITIRDFLKNHPARLLRFFVLKTHYRSPIDYSEEILQQSENELEKIDQFVERIEAIQSTDSSTEEAETLITSVEMGIKGAMEDDFNTAILIAVIFGLIRDGNTLLDAGKISKEDAKKMLAFLETIDSFFGFIFWGKESVDIPDEIKELSEKREQYRKEENWTKSDEARDELQTKGWAIEDTSSGSKLKKLK